ncbi:MAG: carboxypeptidase-like regulatory domain-containing protein [Desulfarculales bacterium]|jgi:nickel transport protein|nr:carboxypeptidase-like regulatory domain-containing protein [Desulfarculales bacterium]
MRAILFAALLLLTPAPAWAHGVKLLATLNEGKISGQSYFVGGGPVMNSPLSLRDQEGKEIRSGRSDERGRFQIILPPDLPEGDYTLLILAGQGHQAESLIRITSAAPARPEAGLTAGPAPAGRAPLPENMRAGLAAIENRLAGLDEKIDQVQLAQAQTAGITWEKIIAGLGYILGLLGLATYCRYRAGAARIRDKKD